MPKKIPTVAEKRKPAVAAQRGRCVEKPSAPKRVAC